MEALMRARARRSLAGHSHVNLTQITFNDSCFGFVWTKFNVLNVIKYQVEVTSIKDPYLPPLVEVIGGTSTEYSICGLDVATPYMVNLSAFGQNKDSMETAVGVMWTTHQVPPTPGDLILLSVGETTMKISLPEVTLTHGPLSAVEIRLNPKRSVPDPEEDSSPWSRVLSRSKRSLEEPCLNKYHLPTVEFPYQMLDRFHNHVIKLGENIKLGPKMSPSGEFTSKGKEVSQMKEEISGKVESDETVLSDLQKPDVAMEDKRIQSMAEGDESQDIVIIEEEEKKFNIKILSSYPVNDSLEGWGVAVKKSIKETFSNLEYTQSLNFLEEKQFATKDVTSAIELKNEQEKGNVSINNYVMKVLGEWLQPDTLSIPVAREVSFNLSKVAPVTLDFGFDSNFDTIYTLSRPEVVRKQLKPASDLEDIWILVHLVHDINTVLNIEESSKYKLTESKEKSSLDDNIQLKSSTQKSNTTYPTSLKVQSNVTNSSDDQDHNVRQEPVDEVAPIGAKKNVRAKRSLKWKWPSANRQKEVDDGLDIDPYQTIQVVTKNGSQPTLVKTGFGYFISDHYGVRHPYFNNTKLAQNLLRYNRYQEIKDFVYYGQSLLTNITNMTEDMLGELRLRIDKIMEINRKRKTKLYLEMFEDFLSLDRIKRQIQTNIPDPGRLGLPPGYQVAHFTDGMPKNITLGNHVEYGGIPNPPLEPSTEYEVVLSVLSSVADVTKHSWISINVTTAARVHKIFSPIFVILSGAFMATCLFICLLGCFVLWCSKGKRKLPFDDDQFDDLRLQLPTDFQTKSPSNMHGDHGPIYRGPQPSTYQRNMYQVQPPPTPGPPPPQYPAFPYSPFLMPPFIPPYNDLPPKSENKVKVVKKTEIDPEEEEEDESSGNEGDNIQTTDNSVDEDVTLPNYLRKSHKPESHWNRIYDVSSKRFLVEKRENLVNQGVLGPEVKNYMRDEDDDIDGLTFRDEYLSLSVRLQNLSANALTIGTDFNRFPHIHLCEQSRVVLKPDASSDNTIIHANFIHGFPNKKVSYIAAMSPFNDPTVLDFWK